jgi:hypothetical protein
MSLVSCGTVGMTLKTNENFRLEIVCCYIASNVSSWFEKRGKKADMAILKAAALSCSGGNKNKNYVTIKYQPETWTRNSLFKWANCLQTDYIKALLCPYSSH